MNRALSAFFPILLVGALTPWAVPGCQATVGPCEDGNCPTVPGCEGETTVVCDAKHMCMERVCEGVGWICGLDAQGTYVWLRKNAPCDDGDLCTTADLCVTGRCVGTPKTCRTPPPRVCVNSKTLRSYAGKGTCDATTGTCAYPATTATCPDRCQGGKCVGSPCTGVTCDTPPGPCYKKPGVCGGGTCSYTPLPAGRPCAAPNKCVTGATCDGKGGCKGSTKTCAAPHTTGGTCVGGACQGYRCASGWGNCNGAWSDGCETPLKTTAHCGSCSRSCQGGSHATPSCKGGSCTLSCQAPYKDCDGKASNGCEIPVGVSGRCNKSGLTGGGPSPTGCGTAWCGSSSTSQAKNFGTWTCVFCQHCHHYSDGYSWCLFGSGSPGNFSSARCSTCCNSGSADKVCRK